MSYFFCFIAIFLFSTLEVVSKKFMLPPIAACAYRFLIGGILLVPLAVFKTKGKINFKGFSKIGFAGILNVTIAMAFLQFAVHYGKAGLSAILVSTNPLFTAIFASLILKEHLKPERKIGLFIGLMGLVAIVLAEKQLLQGTSVLGVVFGLLASITFALYTVFSKKYVKQYGNFAFNAISFIIGGLVLAGASTFTGHSIAIELNKTNVLVLLYLGIFVTGIAYLTFFEGLKKLPAATGAMFFFLKPFIAAGLAYVFLKEKLHYIQGIGVIIVILGLNTELFIKKIKSGKKFKKVA